MIKTGTTDIILPCTCGGTSTYYELTPIHGTFTGYKEGLVVAFQAASTASGGFTYLAIVNNSVEQIRRADGTTLSAGDIIAGEYYLAMYVAAGRFELLYHHGDIDVNGNADVSGNIAVGGTLGVTGNVDFDGTADIAGTLDIGASTTRRVAPSGTFVDDSDGYPAHAIDLLTLHSVLTTSWQSVGPTGSGADIIANELDDVPSDADWIEVVFIGSLIENSSTGMKYLNVFATTPLGGGTGTGFFNSVVYERPYVTTLSTSAQCGFLNPLKLQIDSNNMFSLQKTQTIDSFTLYMSLKGWGFNP